MWGRGTGAVTTYADLDEDFIPRFPRELTADEKERAQLLMEDASFWLGVWVPGLQTAIAGGNEQVAEAAKLLVVTMARRALVAPTVDDGVESRLQTAGPFQHTITYRAPDGNLYLQSRELEALTGMIRPSAVSMTSLGL